MLAATIVLALLTVLVATEPDSGESPRTHIRNRHGIRFGYFTPMILSPRKTRIVMQTPFPVLNPPTK